jgi:hypothetical protein
MKFSTKEDIEAPIEDAFALFVDFDQFERSALRRGGQVRRTDSLKSKGVGMSWDAGFKFRGKARKVSAELIAYEPNDGYEMDVQSSDLNAIATLELMSLSKSRTRATLSVELKPKSLSGRLMIQTMRLGKSRLDKRYRIKASDFARIIERQHKSNVKAQGPL